MTRVSSLQVLLLFLLLSACGVPVSQPRGEGLIGEVTDPERYHDMITAIGNNAYVGHFPDRIPHDAVSVDFYYAPRVFQGASLLQLELTLTPEDFESVRSTFTSQEGFTYAGPPPCFLIESANDCKLAAQFELIVLRAEDLGGSGPRWNHGVSSGVALDPMAGRVVYWYSAW
jgi:hypothetical protein